MKTIKCLFVILLALCISGCFRTNLVVIKGGYLPPGFANGTVVKKTTYLEKGKYNNIVTTITIKGDDIEILEELDGVREDKPE